MKWSKITKLFLVFIFIIGVVYDVYVFCVAKHTDTISWVIYQTSKEYPVIPYGFGFVMGHLFWPIKVPKEVNVEPMSTEEIAKLLNDLINTQDKQMKLSSISEYKIPEPSEKMVQSFEKRTKQHINTVGKYLEILHDKTDLGDELLERAETHDDTKYGPKEREPYIWLTEFHRCKNNGEEFKYPPGVEDKVRAATYHHITNNRQNPEFHKSPSDMSDIDIAEMVADWAAMAEELGQGSPRGWAEKNVGSKWKFSEGQTDLIFRLIDLLD